MGVPIADQLRVDQHLAVITEQGLRLRKRLAGSSDQKDS